MKKKKRNKIKNSENNTTLFAIFILLLLILFVSLFYLFQGKSPRSNLSNPKGENFSFRDISSTERTEYSREEEHSKFLDISLTKPNTSDLLVNESYIFSGELNTDYTDFEGDKLVCQWEYKLYDENDKYLLEESYEDAFEQVLTGEVEDICNFSKSFDIPGQLRIKLTTHLLGSEESILTERAYNIVSPS